MKIGLPEKLAFIFVFIWTVGEVFNVSHMDNVIFTSFMTFAFAFYFGFYKFVSKNLGGC